MTLKVLSVFLRSVTTRFSADVDASDLPEEWPSISAPTAAVLLLLTTITVSVCSGMLLFELSMFFSFSTFIRSFSSEFFVGSIEGVSKNSGISEAFIGVILLPLVGNAAEHVTAITVAMKNKPDLTMAVAVGSSTQVTILLLFPKIHTSFLCFHVHAPRLDRFVHGTLCRSCCVGNGSAYDVGILKSLRRGFNVLNIDSYRYGPRKNVSYV